MRRFLTVFILAIMVTGVVSAAGKGSRSGSHPHRYLPNSFDGAIVQVENTVDGRVWSAWSYRNGGEYDLALSVSTAPGVWSEPILIGLDDGVNQRQPVIAVDSRGATYVAYADGTAAIRLTALQPGRNQWSSPGIVAMGEGLSAPSLMLVGNVLIVGYRDGDGVALHAVPLLEPEYVNQVRSIYDGPDPTTGRDDDEDDEDNETSSNETSIFGMGVYGGWSIRPVGTTWSDHDDD